MTGDSPALSTHAAGEAAEKAAARWLTGRGFRILATNVRTRTGEIDIVGMDGDTLCFVEVKARWSRTLGSPLEAVTTAKQRRLGRAAALYLQKTRFDGPCRFDVLGMEHREGCWVFDLVENAFELG